MTETVSQKNRMTAMTLIRISILMQQIYVKTELIRTVTEAMHHAQQKIQMMIKTAIQKKQGTAMMRIRQSIREQLRFAGTELIRTVTAKI